ncbi:hypothetical protein ACSQ67_020434 [Phaseolus vulgaris]
MERSGSGRGGGRGRGRGRGGGRGRRSPSTPPVVVGKEQCGCVRGSEEKNRPQNSSPDCHSDSDSVGIGVAKLKICDDVDKPSPPPPPAAAVGEGVFDICPRKQPGTVVLKPSLLVKNRERRRSKEDSGKVQGVGGGSGRFLPAWLRGRGRNAFEDDVPRKELGSSHLSIRRTTAIRRSQTPLIPPEFHTLVSNALRDSNALFPHDPLPSISPDICIVNFYSQTGRLGLHQDKDESKDSLRRGLPVVSFSIGYSAQFLYGDHRDPDKAQKLQLESGDVLIFGGPSRNVFHGVTAIDTTTAPNLLQHINLRPGRLNLTFRQY